MRLYRVAWLMLSGIMAMTFYHDFAIYWWWCTNWIPVR